MIVLRALVLSLTLTTFAATGFAMSTQGCGGDCASCHTMSVQEAGKLLGGLGTVTAVRPAPLRGLYEVTLERDGKTAIAYVDFGKKHLVPGPLYDLATRKVVGPAAAAPHVERVNPASLKTDHALVMGNPKGKKRLVVFTDPECPFCAKMHGELKKLAAMEPDLAIYIELFPLKMHPHAYDKARVILGNHSLDLLEKSYAGEKLPAPGTKDGKKTLDAMIKSAASIGVSATPTLVLPDGRVMPGFKDAQSVQKLL